MRTLSNCCLVLLASCLLIPSANGFKIDTHVFIAQEVINDVTDDGQVSLVIGGEMREYDVPGFLTTALAESGSYFRMGSIGPDAVPGVISGQSVIHPGAEDVYGWGTGHWLAHLTSNVNPNSSDEVAYAAGYLTHAASDAFAHTYVNHYAGRPWDLEGETHVERRHFILESFIASKNPEIKSRSGSVIGPAYRAVQAPNGGLALPVSFLAKTFIFNSTASSQFSQGAPHLSFLYQHNQLVSGAEAAALELSKEIEKVAFQYSTGIRLNNEEIEKLRRWINRLRKFQMPVDELKELSDWLTELRIKHAEIHGDVLEGSLEALIKAYTEYAKLQEKIGQKAHEISKLDVAKKAKLAVCKGAYSLNKRSCEVKKDVCGYSPLGELFCDAVDVLDPTCWRDAKRVFREAMKSCEQLAEVTSLENQVRKAMKVQSELNKQALSILVDVKKIANEVEGIVIAGIQLENELLQAALDLANIFLEDVNPIVSYLRSWRLAIGRAGEQFIVANAQAITNSITPNASSIEPLEKWLACFTLPIAGVPSPVNDAICSIDGTRENVLGRVKEIARTIGEWHPATKLMLQLIEEVEKAIAEVVTEVVVSTLEEVTGEPVRELLDIVEEPGTPQNVTRAFTSGEEYNLRSIPDAAFRVGREMRLVDGRYDPDKFPPIYNAIVLSKLSLLSPVQLSQVAKDAGVVDTIYGPDLFDGETLQGSNALVGALRSIDGSHQWRIQAMPFLTTEGHQHAPYERYTYDIERDPANGFRFWQDKSAREKVFRKLFIGPLVAGIDAPDSIGFPPVLHGNYPYKVCEENPYPNDNNPDHPDVVVDNRCQTIRVKPILDEHPDPTGEDITEMMAIHRELAHSEVPLQTLTVADQWLCRSANVENFEDFDWIFRFRENGTFEGRAIQRKEQSDSDPTNDRQFPTTYGGIDGEFEVIGDFLFTMPRGSGVLVSEDDKPEVPTLNRRFTEHPQRYWIERTNHSSRILLWNQDGTWLECKGMFIPAAAST